MITIKVHAFSTPHSVSDLRKLLVVHRKNGCLVVTANFDTSAAGELPIRKRAHSLPPKAIRQSYCSIL